MKNITIIVALILISFPSYSMDESINPEVLSLLKNSVFFDHPRTFYCGCKADFAKDKVDINSCGLNPQSKYAESANILGWEHIVPSKYLVGSHIIQKRKAELEADLHNILPVVGQIKKYRKSARHGATPHMDLSWRSEKTDKSMAIEYTSIPDKLCDVRFEETKGDESQNKLEPTACTKGDIARVWLYAYNRYGIQINDEFTYIYLRNYRRWSEEDAVSPWEKQKHDRIAKLQGHSNPYIENVTPDPKGSCFWEK